MQHPSCEWGFGLLHQSIHRDWSSALYYFLHVAEFSLDVPEPLLPRPLLCLLLIKDGPSAFVVPVMSLLIVILSEGLVRTMLPGVTSFSFSICFSMRVEVLFFSGNRVLAFSGLSRLLGALYLSGELLQLSQQALVGDTERLHLREVGCPHRLAGLASLEDWRDSCLCSDLIPSVTERLTLFVKELSFP